MTDIGQQMREPSDVDGERNSLDKTQRIEAGLKALDHAAGNYRVDEKAVNAFQARLSHHIDAFEQHQTQYRSAHKQYRKTLTAFIREWYKLQQERDELKSTIRKAPKSHIESFRASYEKLTKSANSLRKFLKEYDATKDFPLFEQFVNSKRPRRLLPRREYFAQGQLVSKPRNDANVYLESISKVYPLTKSEKGEFRTTITNWLLDLYDETEEVFETNTTEDCIDIICKASITENCSRGLEKQWKPILEELCKQALAKKEPDITKFVQAWYDLRMQVEAKPESRTSGADAVNLKTANDVTRSQEDKAGGAEPIVSDGIVDRDADKEVVPPELGRAEQIGVAPKFGESEEARRDGEFERRGEVSGDLGDARRSGRIRNDGEVGQAGDAKEVRKAPRLVRFQEFEPAIRPGKVTNSGQPRRVEVTTKFSKDWPAPHSEECKAERHRKGTYSGRAGQVEEPKEFKYDQPAVRFQIPMKAERSAEVMASPDECLVAPDAAACDKGTKRNRLRRKINKWRLLPNAGNHDDWMGSGEPAEESEFRPLQYSGLPLSLLDLRREINAYDHSTDIKALRDWWLGYSDPALALPGLREIDEYYSGQAGVDMAFAHRFGAALRQKYPVSGARELIRLAEEWENRYKLIWANYEAARLKSVNPLGGDDRWRASAAQEAEVQRNKELVTWFMDLGVDHGLWAFD